MTDEATTGPSKTAIGVLVLLSFAAGGAAGVIFEKRVLAKNREWHRTGPSWKSDKIAAYETGLGDLRPEQKAKLVELVDTFYPRFQAIFRDDVRPKQAALEKELNARFRDCLDDSQKAKLDRFIAEKEREVEKQRHEYYQWCSARPGQPCPVGEPCPASKDPQPPKPPRPEPLPPEPSPQPE